MGTHEHNPVFYSYTYFRLARFIANITHHQHHNNRTLQGIYFYLVGLLVYNYVRAACGSREAGWPS